MDDTGLSLRLEIRSATPLSGRLEDDVGRSSEFSGWIGLASALEIWVQEWDSCHGGGPAGADHDVAPRTR